MQVHLLQVLITAAVQLHGCSCMRTICHMLSLPHMGCTYKARCIVPALHGCTSDVAAAACHGQYTTLLAG
jgi:hypothetical protein